MNWGRRRTEPLKDHKKVTFSILGSKGIPLTGGKRCCCWLGDCGELTGGVTAVDGTVADGPPWAATWLIRSNPDNDGKVLLVGGPGGPVGNK